MLTTKERGRLIRTHAQQRRWKDASHDRRMEELQRELQAATDQRAAELAAYTNEDLILELKRRGCPVRIVKPRTMKS